MHRLILYIMAFMALIMFADGEINPPDNPQDTDGEISIAFWSFAFVLLLIVTVWFYITQIAPMRRPAGQVEEEIDKEEEVAKRILEHLSDDLLFKNGNSHDEILRNASPVQITKKEDSSVYEYIDDEIHIHYSQYAWDDCDLTDFPVALGAARRHSMENMDLIFPGVLPSIVEEEEFDDETDTDGSENSQETDFDSIQNDENFTNFPTVYKPNVNNNGAPIENLVNKGFSHPEQDISLESQELLTKKLDTKQDRVIIDLPAESSYSRYAPENVNIAQNVSSFLEAVKTDRNDTYLLSRQIENNTQEVDAENYKISSSEEPRHSETQESVITTECQNIVEFTSGNLDTRSDKDDKISKKKDIPIKSNKDVIEHTSVFTLSSCDLEPSFKQDANENGGDDVKLCTSSCPAENDQHSTRDFRSKYAIKVERVGRNNISEEINQELKDALMEDTKGLTGINEETNKSQVGEFQLNGFGDDIADSREQTTHAWTFFSMSGSDEVTAPEKGISNKKLPSGEMDVPTIIVDSYDDGLPSDKSTANADSMAAMNEHDIKTRYGDSFETDIDIDDIDLIDSDELDNEGEFSIYFKRHVSVTDLDKILSEEGQNDANGDSNEVLETDLSVEEPYSEETDVDIHVPRTNTETLQNAEINDAHTATETTYMNDEIDMNIQKSVIVSTTLSDCLDKQVSDEDFDDIDSSDNSLPRSYLVESLFDDVSFQKDGVYGELVLSQLNENHDNQPDESSFDPYGEDWYGFSEEIRRERKPFLFTIPEDEEIGFAEVDSTDENYLGEATDSHIYDNEINSTKETGEEKLLKAPIATVENYDSDFDLDEREETVNKSETEKYNGETDKIEQKMLEDSATTHNIVAEINGMDDVTDLREGENKKSEQTNILTTIPNENGVTQNTGKVGSANIEAVDNTRSVKIVKKIKIFVRKEIKVAKNDRDIMEDLIVNPKQIIEGSDKDKISMQDAIDKTHVLKEVEEDIIFACRDSKAHHSYEVVKSDIGPAYQLMKPVIYEEEKCDFNEIDAKNMEVVAKSEQYVPAKPEPKSVSDTIEAHLSHVEVDRPESDITQVPAQNDQMNIDAEPVLETVDDTTEAQVSPLEVHVLESDIMQHVTQVPAKEDKVNILEPDLKVLANIVVAHQPLVEANTQKNQITRDNTKLPAQKYETTTDPKPHETCLPKRYTTERFSDIAKMKVSVEPGQNIASKTICACASPVEIYARERDVLQQIPAQDDKATITAKTELKIEANAVETQVPHVKTQENINALKEEESKIVTNKEGSKISNQYVTAHSSRAKSPILAEKTQIQSQESPSVKISVQGKVSQDVRENKHVRPSRVSQTPWDKQPRKTYLSSCNIRLTKSHEDLRFNERTPGGMQESIKEEDVPDIQSLQSERSQTPNPPALNRLVSEDDVFESVEPPSIHTAKITVQEVVGDRQRIVILNVKKKVQGKTRWKSLNDLDSIKMALTSPRRSSDLAAGLASFAEEERVEQNESKYQKKSLTEKVVPIVEVKTRHDCKSLPEIESTNQPCKSPVLKVTAVQSGECVTEYEVKNKITKATGSPVLQEEPLQHVEPITEIKGQGNSTQKLPIIRATALRNRESVAKSEVKSKIVKATVTPAFQESPTQNGKHEVEIRQKFKARVSRISLEEETKTQIESPFVTEENGKNNKPPKRITRVHDISQVEVVPQLEQETVTEITDESTKGNKIKIHVSHPVTPLGIKENVVRPHSSPPVEETPKRDQEISLPEISPVVDVRQRQGRESGYGSLGVSPSEASGTRINHVFVLEDASERSVSSLSSIDDEEDGGETLGESRVMVTDLDVLLAQQGAPPPPSPEIEKPELREKVRVLARMEPIPEKVVRINKDEDEESLVIRHVQHAEPIVVNPIIVANVAEQEESHVISAFLVNDGYDDDELDEVFLEEYSPYHVPDSTCYRTHSSDADSETSSVNSLPLKHRHRQTRAALEAANPGVRHRKESSGSSKTTTPVAELENENAPTSSGSSTPENKAHEVSLEESFSYQTPEQSRAIGIQKTTEYTSAFTPVSRMKEVRRPRARSHGNKSDEEPIVQYKGVGTSFQDVMTLPGLNIDEDKFKEAANSRKSMPDLSTARKEQPLNDSPYLRGLSAHTRKWLSQNAWMDSSGPQEDEDLMTSEMFLYPSNRFQPGTNIDASFLSLANERDFPDDISVSTLSTRPQSPMSEFSFAGETPYWGLRRGSTTVIKCSNPRCEREEVLFGSEKTTYTSCPACFTYYCARACRRIHWSEHKKVCFFGRINSYIRSFIYLCHKKEALKFQLSRTAKDGHKKKGRGSVMVTFASAQLARKFMTTGCTFFPSPPTYSSLVDLQAEGVISKHKVALMQHIKDYQPEEEFVLNLAIIAGKMEDLPANPVPRRKVSTVLQVIKIPLSNKLKETSPASSRPSDPNTETKVFYLPKCSRHEFVNENEARRHYCRNISKNLKQYGIRLKHDYPDVYEKLCRYVDQNIRFTEPLTVYGNHGKKIVMCKIMPEAGEKESTA